MKTKGKKQKPECRSHCPVSFGLDAIGDKWSLLIVRDIVFFGKRTYGEFLKGGEGIATNVLASRLEYLENSGFLTKSPNIGDQRKDIYALTEKGLDLIPIVFELVRWSAKHDPLSQARTQPEFIRQLQVNPAGIVEKAKELARSGKSLFSTAAKS